MILNMHKYSPVRNQRSKGIKIKHVLRIFFLVAACCWLIFQIKRSHYKDLESVDTKIVSSTNSVDEVIKLGRKDLQPKETETHEEEDDEIDENEHYKFDEEEETVNESEEKDGQSQTANEAREEHYKADDASSAVSDEHEDQTLDNIKFLEMGVLEHENQVHNGAKIQETHSESTNMSSDNSQYYSESTQVVEESETSLKSTNVSAILTTKENISGSSETEVETEEPEDVQHDAIDSTDFIRLEDLDAYDNGEDTVEK
ncbi:hypothetical protein L1987_55284 [Smallanthus sonchifolius]|uniref:Uncharacterized protein n=1 Tax=Smallanthus sonchifolius TaxID=185202 RepID=A0ACB9E8Z5_9ASTR|nr:hypothetical protein L1987_55284 [Smallanthus sonchifolius]